MNGAIILNNNQEFYGERQKQDTLYFQNLNESAYYQNMTTDTMSNQNNKMNNITVYPNDNYDRNYPYSSQRNNKIPISKKNKKKVKFNEVVDIILVKIYKKYNKDDSSLDDYFNNNNKNNNVKTKKAKNCECNII